LYLNPVPWNNAPRPHPVPLRGTTLPVYPSTGSGQAQEGNSEQQGDPGEAKEIDALNQQLMNRLNESGKLFLSNTVLKGRVALRIAIGNIRTDERAVREGWGKITAMADRGTGRQGT
jgi:hypothetical protein